VKRIRLAQEALSHVEEKVYDLLWGVKNQNRDAHRFAEFSLQRIANEGRLNIKTVRELLPRLIDKGFIAIEREADVRRNRPTQYRVFSYSEVLADQRRRKRFWVIRTGKGVFYAHAVSVGVRRDELTAEPEPMGVESKPLVKATNSVGFESEPMGLEPTSAILSELSRIVRESLDVLPDESLLREMIADCRAKAEITTGLAATNEEILHFTSAKTRVLRHATNLRNPLAVLRKAVPECFGGQPFIEFRSAEQQRRERELQEARDYQAFLLAQEAEDRQFQQRQELRARVSERHRTSQGYDLKAIAEDPEMDQQGREVARERMRRLGRFAGQGL
jgi:predicted transcriptional regulator